MPSDDFTSRAPADPLMQIAWIDCLHWAIGEDKIVEQFRKASGNNWTPGRNGLERMIDEATGVDRAFLLAFIDWFNANIWGPTEEDEPRDQ